MGPKQSRSTVLSVEQEAVAVAFRKQTLLPLDDCLYTLQATIPKLTRSALHRCFQRHGIVPNTPVEAVLAVVNQIKSTHQIKSAH